MLIMTSMMNSLQVENERSEKHFRWGMILTWIPFLFIAIPSIVHATSRSIYKQSGFGLGSITWLPPKALIAVGVVVILAELTALVLLTKAITRNEPMRSALAIMSMCCCVLMITMTLLYFWLIFIGLPSFAN
jgi:hypothetical protein